MKQILLVNNRECKQNSGENMFTDFRVWSWLKNCFLSDVYSGAQFDWDSLYSVFWSRSDSGVKLPTPSPQEPSSYNIYCPEAAHVLLAMAHIMVNEVSETSKVL